MPAPQMLPVGFKEPEEFTAMVNVNQPDLGGFIDSLVEYVPGRSHCVKQIRLQADGQYADLLSRDIMTLYLRPGQTHWLRIHIIGWNQRDFKWASRQSHFPAKGICGTRR
jgi:hypothetical protein